MLHSGSLSSSCKPSVTFSALSLLTLSGQFTGAASQSHLPTKPTVQHCSQIVNPLCSWLRSRLPWGPYCSIRCCTGQGSSTIHIRLGAHWSHGGACHRPHGCLRHQPGKPGCPGFRLLLNTVSGGMANCQGIQFLCHCLPASAQNIAALKNSMKAVVYTSTGHRMSCSSRK